jgi:hypothetical protein
MTFSIKAYPHEIPAATMDEHVVIGGAYFDVLDGTYQLEERGPEPLPAPPVQSLPTHHYL